VIFSTTVALLHPPIPYLIFCAYNDGVASLNLKLTQRNKPQLLDTLS